MSGIRHFSQKNFTKRRFAARNRTRDPDDLSRLCTYRQSVKNLLSTRICAARLIQLQADRPGCLFFRMFFEILSVFSKRAGKFAGTGIKGIADCLDRLKRAEFENGDMPLTKECRFAV